MESCYTMVGIFLLSLETVKLLCLLRGQFSFLKNCLIYHFLVELFTCLFIFSYCFVGNLFISYNTLLVIWPATSLSSLVYVLHFGFHAVYYTEVFIYLFIYLFIFVVLGIEPGGILPQSYTHSPKFILCFETGSH